MHANHKSIDALIAKTKQVMALKHMALKTEKSYIGWIASYCSFLLTHPNGTTEQKINTYLTHLVNNRNVAASTQKQALNAIVWLYKHILEKPVGDVGLFTRSRKPRRLPTVLSQSECQALLRNLTGTHWLIGNLLYGSGLRINECLSLRTQDIDFGQHHIMVRSGKGNKDRTTLLPDSIIPELKQQIEHARRIHRRDLANGYGDVYLPHALERKIKSQRYDFKWQYLFQSSRISECPRTHVQRRHHLDDSTVSKAIKAAAKAANITKRVTAHTLRHSFATRLIESGVDIATVQQLMGHNDIRTTRIYIHVARNSAATIPSPLDLPGNVTPLRAIHA